MDSSILPLVGIVITLLIQIVSTVWFFSKLDSRVETLENGFSGVGDHPSRLTKVEVLLEIIQKQQDEQSLKLDQVLANQAARKDT